MITNNTKKVIFDKNVKKEVSKFIKDKNLKILEIEYRGKRLQSGVLWPKLRNPLRMMVVGAIFDLLRRFPPCELKNHIFRLCGVKIGKDVTIAPYVYVDPLFPELVTIEDGVLVGGTGGIISHEFFSKWIRIGKTTIKKGAQLGARALLRSGITIGENAQVGVYAFVNKDVEGYEFVAGNPAKHLKWIYPFDLKSTNIGEMLEKRANQYNNKIYLIDATKENHISYTEFNDHANRIANYLKSLQITRNDVIAVLLPNHDSFVFNYFAIQKIGAIAYLVNSKLKKEELEFLLKDSKAAYIITNNEFAQIINKIKLKLENLKNIINIDDEKTKNETDKQSNVFETKKVSAEDGSTLIYTSGTTGRPKGVLLTHKNIISNLDAAAERLGLGENTVHLAMRPLFYVAGIFPTILLPMFYGGTTVLYEKFSRTRFWKFVERYKINFAELSTAMIPILLNPPEDVSKYDISSLKFIAAGGATLHEEVVNRFEKHFKVPLFEAYGLTESSCLVTYTPPVPEKRKIGSAGPSLKTTKIKIIDDDGEEAKTHKAGEIFIRGPNVVTQYYGISSYEQKELFEKGWVNTGDIGYLDEDGYLYIIGRKKELIRRGGESISPNEIDDVLYKNPKVKEACTIGVYDEFLGEEVKAYVALKPGTKATAQELMNFCKKNLADYKCPKSIEFMKELPKGPTGKILRKELQEMSKNGRRQ